MLDLSSLFTDLSFGLHVEMEGSVLGCWRPVGLCDLRGIASPGFSQSMGLCELPVNTDPARYYAIYVTVPMGTVKKPNTCLHRNSHVHQIPYQAACPTRRPKLQTPTVFVGMQLAIPTQLKILLAAARILNPKLSQNQFAAAPAQKQTKLASASARNLGSTPGPKNHQYKGTAEENNSIYGEHTKQRDFLSYGLDP